MDGRDKAWRSKAPGPHAHGNTARRVVDGLRTEVCGQQKQSNDPRNNQHNPQYANYWAPLTRKRHTMPHSAQPQHTNYWAPRTRKRHQQEHRPQRPTERSDPTQHAKGRTGDCPGPRKGATTRRNVRGVLLLRALGGSVPCTRVALAPPPRAPRPALCSAGSSSGAAPSCTASATSPRCPRRRCRRCLCVGPRGCGRTALGLRWRRRKHVVGVSRRTPPGAAPGGGGGAVRRTTGHEEEEKGITPPPPPPPFWTQIS